MKFSLYISSILVLCLFSHDGISQVVRNSEVIISGNVLSNPNTTTDSVLVQIANGDPLFGSNEFNINISKNGAFKFKMNSVKDFATITLSIKGIYYYFFHNLIEAGDSLHLEVDARGIRPTTKLSGNNCSKYQCSDALRNERDAFYLRKSNILGPMVENGDIKSIYTFVDSNYLRFTNVLNAFKKKISINAFNYYKGEYTYWYFGTRNALVRGSYNFANNNESKRSIELYFNSHILEDNETDQILASRNQYYIKYIIEKLKMQLLFNSQGKGFLYKTIYNKLKDQYTGILRDRVLTYFLLDYGSSSYVINYKTEDYTQCLVDAEKLVKDVELKNLLIRKEVLKKGAEAFNFSMPDTLGKLVSLNDFKNKVVLLDVWGNGCVGCAEFFASFKKDIYPYLTNEKDFEMISISINPTKKSWINGINTGKYTSRDHINLYTDGLIMKHPFMKFYDIISIPFILLIDKKGLVYSKINVSLSSEEILKMIKAALNEPSIQKSQGK
jgi:cytochrome oxidase Cu insertion factor (SCO1/SenC/PrrC family)